MGFKFRKSIKIAPGVKLNINKNSVGISAGTRGARFSVNSKGRATTTVGIPGSGISYSSTTNLGGSNRQSSQRSNNEPSPTQGPNKPVSKKTNMLITIIIIALIFFRTVFRFTIIPTILYFAVWRKKIVDQDKKKYWDIVSGIVGVISIIVLGNWILNPVIPVEKIEITAQSAEMDIYKNQNISITVTPDNANTEIEYITDNEDVIKLETTDDAIKIISKKEGTATITAKSGDVESNPLTITVIDEARIAEEKAEAERLAQEEAARKAEEERLAQEQAAAQQAEQETAQQEYVPMVWTPADGSGKYHKKSTCSGMKNPVQISLEDAKARGIQPCGRCY